MRNLHRPFPLIALACLVLFTLPARALTIVPTFDSTITSAGDASQIETAFNYAAQQIDDEFTNPITINIDVTSVSGTDTLGMSDTEYSYSGPTVGYTYSQLKGALLANATTPAAIEAVNNLPANNPTGVNYAISNAESKALGLGSLTANGAENDGTFTFGTGYTYTFNPADRAVPGEVDFIGVAEHEITEIMGRTYILGQEVFGSSNGSFYDPFDIFRFTADNTRSLTLSGSNVYFSINNGATDLNNFNTFDANGGDPQDWAATTPYTADSFNAFSQDGYENNITPIDITTMNILGYIPVPEPAALPLVALVSSLLLPIAFRRPSPKTE